MPGPIHKQGSKRTCPPLTRPCARTPASRTAHRYARKHTRTHAPLLTCLCPRTLPCMHTCPPARPPACMPSQLWVACTPKPMHVTHRHATRRQAPPNACTTAHLPVRPRSACLSAHAAPHAHFSARHHLPVRLPAAHLPIRLSRHTPQHSHTQRCARSSAPPLPLTSLCACPNPVCPCGAARMLARAPPSACAPARRPPADAPAQRPSAIRRRTHTCPYTVTCLCAHPGAHLPLRHCTHLVACLHTLTPATCTPLACMYTQTHICSYKCNEVHVFSV